MHKIKKFVRQVIEIWRHIGYKHISRKARLGKGVKVYNKNNLIMGENTNIDAGALIMNTRAKFIMKHDTGAAIGLTVITGNHMPIVGIDFKHITDEIKEKYDPNHELDQDVIVDEEVWIGANVTLLSGVHLNRGATVGAGSVVRTSIPPYAIVAGNPAKIVGFRFSPEEIIEHEKALYPEEERLPLELLEKNYYKYFISRIKEIKEYTRLSL